MDNLAPNTRAPRRFAGRSVKKKKQDTLTWVLSLGWLLIVMGLLVTATGVECVVFFHRRLSLVIFELGIFLSVCGFFIKALEICLKIWGGRK